MKIKTEMTGERLETDIINDSTDEHLHRYAIAMQYAKDKIVLDIASGEGYGTSLLADVARKVFGVDISVKDVEKARLKYGNKKNLNYINGSVYEIPFEDDYFDLVVSFETIEHVKEHDIVLKEIKRVLKKDGILIISTPDKRTYSDIPNFSNPFHLRELYTAQFETLIKKYFVNIFLLNQKILSGSLIYNNEIIFNELYEGDFYKIKKVDDILPVYNLIISSDSDFQKPNASFFRKSDKNNLRGQIVDEIRNSNSYRLGNFILKPLSFLKNIFK